jgi:hypothetical protein
MKLKSFGCSFIFGTDLYDDGRDGLRATASQHTWPALLAQHLGYEYQCHARPGAGNLQIWENINNEIATGERCLYVIGWTWIDRFDYVDADEKWQTIRPGDDTPTARQYFRLFNSQIKDMMTSIYAVHTAIVFLQQRNIPFLMSYMDYSMMEAVDPGWHDPKYVSLIQTEIRDYLLDFDGKNFLDWSRDNKFPISDQWHPLEQAHAAAAEYMAPAIDAILRRA